MRRNNFITPVWKKAWKKKNAILDCFIDIACFLIIFTLVTSETLNLDSIGKLGDGDPREEIAVVAGFVAVAAWSFAAGGAIAAGAATVPVWVTVVGGIGAGAGIISAGCAFWDHFDGPEDNCNDCDGSGCPTCEPPDDDNCPNCDGSGCDTCNPPQ